jgi:5-methylthioribose kinase
MVIDPEFAFFGPMAYDVGALIANLLMAYISADAWIEDKEVKEKQKEYLLKITGEVIDLFNEKFLKTWDEVVTDDMAKVEGFKEHYLEDVLINTAGVSGCEMIRRTVGFAHVKDLDAIPNNDKRIDAKKTNILMAKDLIKNRAAFTSGEEYINLIKKYF